MSREVNKDTNSTNIDRDLLVSLGGVNNIGNASSAICSTSLVFKFRNLLHISQYWISASNTSHTVECSSRLLRKSQWMSTKVWWWWWWYGMVPPSVGGTTIPYLQVATKSRPHPHKSRRTDRSDPRASHLDHPPRDEW